MTPERGSQRRMKMTRAFRSGKAARARLVERYRELPDEWRSHDIGASPVQKITPGVALLSLLTQPTPRTSTTLYFTAGPMNPQRGSQRRMIMTQNPLQHSALSTQDFRSQRTTHNAQRIPLYFQSRPHDRGGHNEK